jgi:hypothetical protein
LPSPCLRSVISTQSAVFIFFVSTTVDIFEDAWGWERILPQDDSCSMPFYLNYLKEYLWRNGTDYVTAADGTSDPENWPLEIREVGAVTQGRRNGEDSLTTAAEFVSSCMPLHMTLWWLIRTNLFVFTNLKCLDMEQQFMTEYESQPIRNVNVKLLSERIQERACYLIHMEQEFSEPAAASLLVCRARLQNQCVILYIRSMHFLSKHWACYCNTVRWISVYHQWGHFGFGAAETWS